MQYVPGYVNQMNKLLSISHAPALVKLDLGATDVAEIFRPRGAFHLHGVMRFRTGSRPNENWGEQSRATLHAAHSENFEKGE